MSLTKLPSELIYEIASRLPRASLISLGLRTGNTHIYSSCSALFRPHIEAFRHGRIFFDRLGGSPKAPPLLTEQAYHRAGLDIRLGPYRANSTPSLEFWGPFQGDLDWWPFPEAFHRTPIWIPLQHELVDHEEYNLDSDWVRSIHGIYRALDLGASVPKALVKLITLPLECRLDFWRSLGRPRIGWTYDVRRCVRSMAGEGETAYIMDFIVTGPDPGIWTIYMPVGENRLGYGHAVVNRPAHWQWDYAAKGGDRKSFVHEDTWKEVLEAEEAGLESPANFLRGQVHAESVNLDEWLAIQYLERRLREEDYEASEFVKEYIRYNFTATAASC